MCLSSLYLHSIANPMPNSLHLFVAGMITKFHKDEGVIAAGLGLFGPVDVGQSVLWWDYGQVTPLSLILIIDPSP